MSSTENVDNAEIIQPEVDCSSDYTILELEERMKKALQDEVSTGRKISFVTAINALMNVYTIVVLTYERKEAILQTMVFHFSAIVSKLREGGHVLNERFAATLDQLKQNILDYLDTLPETPIDPLPQPENEVISTPEVPVQQE